MLRVCCACPRRIGANDYACGRVLTRAAQEHATFGLCVDCYADFEREIERVETAEALTMPPTDALRGRA